jgi:D-arabinose 1-dehydrogenase-like Zn-dependent alcohol dehydrogenase
VPSTHTFVLPEGLDLANVPPVLCAGCTVYPPMKRHITKEGASIAVIGIGGLGHLAVQYAKAMGHHVAAFTSSAEKTDYIKKLGAHEVIVVDKELKVLADHAGKFDYLINTLPNCDSATLEGYLDTLANGGTLIQVGLPDISQQFSISYMQLIKKQITITGSIVSSVKETRETLEFTAKHGIRVETEDFSFEDFPKAVDRLEHGRPFFRCVVNVQDFTNKHFH